MLNHQASEQVWNKNDLEIVVFKCSSLKKKHPHVPSRTKFNFGILMSQEGCFHKNRSRERRQKRLINEPRRLFSYS